MQLLNLSGKSDLLMSEVYFRKMEIVLCSIICGNLVIVGKRCNFVVGN